MATSSSCGSPSTPDGRPRRKASSRRSWAGRILPASPSRSSSGSTGSRPSSAKPRSRQAKAIRLDVAEALASEPDREDIRDWFTVTIDPVDARDFDDAITLERVDGRVRLGVHIADVSHYVPWDSSIDIDARQRATSVYLVDRVLPMLPEELSNGICSLNPGEDRLSFSVVMDLDNDAVVQSYRALPERHALGPSLQLRRGAERGSTARQPFPDAESEQLLRDFARIAETIGKRRVARGGLDFESVEAKVRLAEDGTPLEVVLRQRTQATNMIEEAMILANETVASHMSRAKAPMVYRIHEDPDPDALAQIAVILKEFDYPIKDINGATPATFQKIIAFAHKRPEKLLINSLLLRAMERARYVDYLAPHFGLASKAYCHFTSPIRRYPDLIVHRLLKAQLRGQLAVRPARRLDGRRARVARRALVGHGARGRVRRARLGALQAVRAHGRARGRGLRRHRHRRAVLRAVRAAREHRRGARARRLRCTTTTTATTPSTSCSSARRTASATGSGSASPCAS